MTVRQYILSSILIFVWGVFPNTLFAQLPYVPQTNSSVPDQSIYFEAGGNGILYSMNYDLRFENNFGFRLGISGVPVGITNDRNQNEDSNWYNFRNTPFLFSVIMGNYFIGTETSSFELGAGIVIGDINDEENWTRPEPNAATFTIGYRYMNRKRWHPTVKAGLTPMINFDGQAHMRFGISIGLMLSGED